MPGSSLLGGITFLHPEHGKPVRGMLDKLGELWKPHHPPLLPPLSEGAVTPLPGMQEKPDNGVMHPAAWELQL